VDSTKIVEVAVPALISAIVAGIGAVLAYRRWWHEKTEGFGAQFRVRRLESYEELWRRVEQVHSHLRATGAQQAATTASLDLNSYLLERSLYIDVQDRRLAAEYIRALREVADRIWAGDSQEAKDAWESTLERIPEETLQAARELSEAWRRANELRAAVIERIRTVMGAKFAIASEDG
jgi:hypothetical protein